MLPLLSLSLPSELPVDWSVHVLPILLQATAVRLVWAPSILISDVHQLVCMERSWRTLGSGAEYLGMDGSCSRSTAKSG